MRRKISKWKERLFVPREIASIMNFGVSQTRTFPVLSSSANQLAIQVISSRNGITINLELNGLVILTELYLWEGGHIDAL